MGLTIVTVVKNDPAGVDYTLASIARQDSPVPLFLMDGGSTDTTLDTIDAWKTSLHLEIESEPDAGPYDAMNKALAKLKGDDLVWFVNAGDALYGERAFSRATDLTQLSDFTWGFGPHRIIETSGELRRIESGRRYSLANHAYGRTPICHQAVIARVGCLHQVGAFDLRYPIAADFQTLLLLGERWRPRQWTDTLVEYRAGGISDRDLSNTIQEQGLIRRKVLNPQGASLLLDHLHDTKRLARHKIRTTLTRAGLDPGRLKPRGSTPDPAQDVGGS